MFKPNRSDGGLFGASAVLVLVAMLVGACGGSPVPAGQATPAQSTPAQSAPVLPSTEGPGATDSLLVGPVSTQLPEIDTASDPNLTLQASEDEARTRQRDQAGLPEEFGTGWDALSTAVDDATDAAAQSLAAEFGVTRRNAQFASIEAPNRPEPGEHDSAAAALALLGASLAASSLLGLEGTQQPVVDELSTTTSGDSTATVNVNGQGVATASGSRVWATFTFDLSGTVTNNTTGATATMTGSATSYIEIDGCPDAGGHSKGKVTLSSKETASNGVGWTRDMTGDFDITVDDEANISQLNVDIQAKESVADGHDLGIKSHAEFGAGAGFSAMTHNADALTLEITDENNATSADLLPLFTSALTSVTAGAHILGSAAETFWRDGKCIEVIVAPAGGDVDANSTTEVTAKVKHRIEGKEINKPVEATLNGVKTIDPAGVKQPAPAKFTYTAGAKPGEKGDIEFKSVSNRGIGKKSVTFTVKASGWTTTATDPLGSTTGTKCNGLGGDWLIQGTQDLGMLKVKIKVVVTINETTLEGTFDFHKDQVGGGTVTTHQSNGKARVVLNADGSVTMTLDPAKITLTTKTQFGSATATTQGDKFTYPWTPAPAGACSTT